MIIGWIIAAVVAVVVGGAALMAKMQAKMQGKQAGMMIAKEGGSNPIKMVYGKRRIGTDNAWKGVSNLSLKTSSGWDSAYIHYKESELDSSHKNKEFLHRLDVWCQGPVHSIGNYKIDGDKTSHTRFANGSRAWARILTKHGNPNQTMFSAMSSGLTAIDASMKGDDLAWSWSRFYYHPEKPEYQGEPNVTAEVQGLKVWDPRTNFYNPTVKSWSDNPALCLLDYLLADYGRELLVADIDIASFIAAANSCDAMVPLPDEPVAAEPTVIYVEIDGTTVAIEIGDTFPDYRVGQASGSRKRYTTNLILESDNSTIDNCAEILKTMKGSLPFVNGKYKLLMEEEGSAVMSFSNDNILGGVSLGWADRSKRTNRVTVKFPNENKGYQDDTVSWPAANSALHLAYKAYDNDEDLHSEFELTGVTDFYQARDMAEFAVRESRSQEYVTFKTQPQAMALECGDVITVSNDALDIVSKLYRVRETSMNADLTVTVKAQIYDATIYPWSVGDEAAEAVTLNMTPSLFDQPAVMQNVTASTATLLNDDGTALTEATVTWDEIETGTSEIDYVEIGYKLNAETVYVWAILPAESLSHTITGLQDVQLYNIAARYRNTVGKFSDVVVVNIGTLTAGTNLDAAAAAAQATANAAALVAAQAVTDAAAAAALVTALDFSTYLINSDLPDLSAFITQAEADAAQGAAETYADGITENFQTAAQVSSAIAADETVIDGARITTGTINAARISLTGHSTSELTNNSGFATGDQVSAAQTAAEAAAATYADLQVTGLATTAELATAQSAAEAAAATYAELLFESAPTQADITAAQTAAEAAAATYADLQVTGLATTAELAIAQAAAEAAAATYADLLFAAAPTAAEIAISISDAVGAIDLSGYVANGDLAGYVTTVQGVALQAAAEEYADGITENFQTAAQVSSAIATDTTVIDGARITTGTINAARISISGLDASDLNNDAFAVPADIPDISGLAASADIPDISGLAASADVTAAQAAAQLYADGLVTGFQTAAQVSTAIESDTTVIDGARITTGTINAARISLSGFNLSDLNNDGFALSTDIPNISNLQTAAQVTTAIQTDTTTINGSRIVTGTLSAGTISGGTLDFTNVTAGNLFVNSISGDVNTLIPFKKQTTQTIPYLTSSTSFTIFEGTIPASGSADIKRKPYISATGWGVFENDDVYKLELWMRVNAPAASGNTSYGAISNPEVFTNPYMGTTGSLQVSGQIYLPAGTLLKDQYMTSVRTLGSVWYSFYNSSTNKTTISYQQDPVSGVGPILAYANRSLVIPPPPTSYTLVNEFFFRSPFDYDPYQFAINGALSDSTEHSVDCQIKLRLFNQVGSGSIPYSQPSKNWNYDRIYNVSGIMMSLR